MWVGFNPSETTERASIELGTTDCHARISVIRGFLMSLRCHSQRQCFKFELTAENSFAPTKARTQLPNKQTISFLWGLKQRQSNRLIVQFVLRIFSRTTHHENATKIFFERC